MAAFICLYCGQTFLFPRDFYLHLKDEHHSKEKS